MGWIKWASNVPAQSDGSGYSIANGAPYEAHPTAVSGAIQSATGLIDGRIAAHIRERQRRILARYVYYARIR
jgi:hypothetical protein